MIAERLQRLVEEMVDRGVQFDGTCKMAPLDEEISRLRPVSVTAQIHVNRYPIFEYFDN